MKKYKDKLQEMYETISVFVDASTINTVLLQSKLDKLVGWDAYDVDQRGDWKEYTFSPQDFKRASKIFNLKDKENFIVEYN